jgi:hypothetical protein
MSAIEDDHHDHHDNQKRAIIKLLMNIQDMVT